jgi:diguanylate cyclase (GGDEF)-like protein/PAS domain S-box-containing protein
MSEIHDQQFETNSEEHRKYIQALLALHQNSLELHGQFELQKLLEHTTQQAAALVGTNSGGLYLFDETRNDLELVVSHNGPQDHHGIRMVLGEGVAGRVARTLQPLFIEDYSLWEGQIAVWKGVIKSVAAVPLVWQGQLIGVMTASELQKIRSFSSLEIDLLQLFADQAASAIYNARLRRSLEDSEARYRSIIDSTLMSVFIIQDGTIVYVNDHACKISGFAREEIIGKAALEFVAPSNKPEIQEKLANVRTMQTGQIHHATARTLHKEGHHLDVEFYSQWITLAGKPTLVGTAVDVTAQRNIERLRQRLTEIGRKILTMTDLSQILKDVAEAIVAHTSFRIAGISVYDQPALATETKGYRIADFYCAGITPVQEAQGRELIRSNLFVPHHKIIQQGLRIGLDSYYVSPSQIPEITQGIATVFSDSSEWGPHDTLYVVLKHEEEIWGRISLADPVHGRLPTAQELEPLEALANLAAIAIEKAEHWSELDRALSRVRLLNRTLKAINESLTLEEILSTIIKSAKELIPKAQGGSFLRFSEADQSFEFQAAVGRNLGQLQRIRLPYAETLKVLKLDSGPQILTRSTQLEHRAWAELGQGLGEPPASTLTLPIVRQKKIIGILNLNNFEDEGAFMAKDIAAIAELLPEVEIALARAQDREALRQQALRDPLTGVYNRRYLNELIQEKLAKAHYFSESFAFLMLDFDRFYLVNDQLGHLIGDRFLQDFASFLQSQLRVSDAIIRYGGDEFLVILLKTSHDDAQIVSRRLDEACAMWLKKFLKNQKKKLAISLSSGLAVWTPQGKKDINHVLDEADQFMYRRKHSKQRRSQVRSRKQVSTRPKSTLRQR